MNDGRTDGRTDGHRYDNTPSDDRGRRGGKKSKISKQYLTYVKLTCFTSTRKLLVLKLILSLFIILTATLEPWKIRNLLITLTFLVMNILNHDQVMVRNIVSKLNNIKSLLLFDLVFIVIHFFTKKGQSIIL